MANVMRRVLFSVNVIRRVNLSSIAKQINYDTKLKSSTAVALGHKRHFNSSARRFQEERDEEEEEQGEGEEGVTNAPVRPVHDVETSKRYMASKAYAITYGTDPVWVPYRRNHIGLLPPSKTRKSCIRGNHMSTGNPCPICRDEYLVIDSQHPDLLNQFISEQTGELLSYQKTGVCQRQHRKLLIELEKAWDIGTVEKPIPFRHYDYSTYYPQLKTDKQ